MLQSELIKSKVLLPCFIIFTMLISMFVPYHISLAATNIALGKTATASSTQSGSSEGNAIDGNTSTRWCAANGNLNHWWQVDLGSSQSISGTEVMWEFSGRVYGYKIETSTDNNTWTLRADKTNNTSTAQTQSDSFSATARYVRITVTSLPASTWASFFEFRVFDNSSGGGSTTQPALTNRQIETLDRGVVAVKVTNGVFVSWRALGTEALTVGYNLYRGTTKLNSTPLTTKTNYTDTAGTASSTYQVAAVVNGVEQAKSPAVSVLSNNYQQIPLDVPSGGTTPDNVSYTYSANDCSVGDLNGDGKYEIIVKWDPSNSKDNSQSGYTGNVYIDAYTLTGTKLWRIDLGKNIRAGAHYTQIMVYDLDGDGKAEIAMRTADGTKDGLGNVIGSSTADYRNASGYILSGPEYLTIFNGQTGAAMVTTTFEPARGNVTDWGDNYGNRVDRFLACIAYLDGQRPSLVMCRGYYEKTMLVAYDYRNGSLTKRWTFNSSNGYTAYQGQGNHNISVADVDGDGKDEIIYGSCAIDDNGTGLWTSGLGHGDALHVSDFNPDRPGFEVWGIHEGTGTPGSALLDARTGAVIWKTANADVGRGVAANITSAYRGAEMWGGTSDLRTPTNTSAGNLPSSANFVVWWDGDLQRELLDDINITKYGGGTLLTASGCASNNGTKATPNLSVDIFGDWREEVIWRTTDSKYLRIYTTTTPTEYRFYTFMHDPVYRLGIAWQNVAYNQPPHTSFYLGD
ncbi:rhamnogalacturonan lyase family protein [Lachnoclostridium sp.]|uniref:rhamnogalacturonan lyase family protein n=1 Tax=Lachnoclostridium sp. TaxID=2028282 RepID=UPI00289C87F3|nr:discoidin domain-containing protein [Lachnoclostridium sp.]